MHKLYIHAGEEAERDLKTVETHFGNIYRASEKIEGKYDPPDEEQLLRYHCIAFEPWVTLADGSDGWVKPKQLVRSLLAEKVERAKAEWIKGFSQRLSDTFDSALQILDARGDCEPWGNLTVLGRTAIFWPLLLKCWRFDTTQGHEQFSQVVRCLEHFAFQATVAGKRSGAGEPYLRKLARDFASNFEQLVKSVEEMDNWWGIPQQFPIGLRQEYFYSEGRVATYLLWRYENYLRSQTGNQWPKFDWRTVVDPANAAVRWAKDHIEAQDENNPVLKRLVKWNPNDKDEIPQAFEKIYLHRLGNLVLDTIAAGASKGNRVFGQKADQYENSGMLSQIEIVKKFASVGPDCKRIWDEEAIRRRQEALVIFARTQL